MGIGGKMTLLGVLTPSQVLQERWKQKENKDEMAKLVAQQGADLIIPTRAEAGMAFATDGSVQLTQMRGRNIPKLEDAVVPGESTDTSSPKQSNLEVK